MCLVPLQSVVGVELILENPFVGDNVGANRARDKIPGVVGVQGSKLFFHCVTLIRIDKGRADRGEHR
jgi:hypothetical protein